MSAIFGLTFDIGRMTEVLTPDIYRAHWGRGGGHSPSGMAPPAYDFRARKTCKKRRQMQKNGTRMLITQ